MRHDTLKVAKNLDLWRFWGRNGFDVLLTAQRACRAFITCS